MKFVPLIIDSDTDQPWNHPYIDYIIEEELTKKNNYYSGDGNLLKFTLSFFNDNNYEVNGIVLIDKQDYHEIFTHNNAQIFNNVKKELFSFFNRDPWMYDPEYINKFLQYPNNGIKFSQYAKIVEQNKNELDETVWNYL